MANADGVRKEAPQGPVGIGGWLLLVIFGFVGTIVLTGINLIATLKESDGLKNIMFATSGPLVELRAPLVADLLSGILVVISAAYCLYLIASKNALIVNIATIHYLILASAGFCDLWTDAAIRSVAPNTPVDPGVYTEVVRGVLIACIWIPYFRMSKRVKNTFVARGTGGLSPAV